MTMLMFGYFSFSSLSQVLPNAKLVFNRNLDTSLTGRKKVMKNYQVLMDTYVSYSGLIPPHGVSQDSVIRLLSDSVFSPKCNIFDELIPRRVKMADGLWYKTRYYISKSVHDYLEEIKINFPKGISRVVENANWNLKDWKNGKVSVRLSRTSTAIDTGGYQFKTNDTVDIQMYCTYPALQARIVAIKRYKSQIKIENSPLPLLRIMNLKDFDSDGILNENDTEPTLYNKQK